jgi:hypothetical protein
LRDSLAWMRKSHGMARSRVSGGARCRTLSGSREITVPVTDAAKEGTAEESEPESTATESVVAPYITGSSGSSGSLVAPYLTD